MAGPDGRCNTHDTHRPCDAATRPSTAPAAKATKKRRGPSFFLPVGDTSSAAIPPPSAHLLAGRIVLRPAVPVVHVALQAGPGVGALPLLFVELALLHRLLEPGGSGAGGRRVGWGWVLGGLQCSREAEKATPQTHASAHSEALEAGAHCGRWPAWSRASRRWTGRSLVAVVEATGALAVLRPGALAQPAELVAALRARHVHAALVLLNGPPARKEQQDPRNEQARRSNVVKGGEAVAVGTLADESLQLPATQAAWQRHASPATVGDARALGARLCVGEDPGHVLALRAVLDLRMAGRPAAYTCQMAPSHLATVFDYPCSSKLCNSLED